MSSLRNAVRQRQHRERGQLPGRERLGLLEKKKDYVLRAKDHHFKGKRLAALRQKAYFRNPDEFYFKMINSRTKNGVHILEDRSKKLPEEMRKLVKSQDMKYVAHARSIDKKKMDRLHKELQFISVDEGIYGAGGDPMDEDDEEGANNRGRDEVLAARPKHTIFLENEQEAKHFQPAQHFNTVPELVGRRFNRLTQDQLKTESMQMPNQKELKQQQRERSRKYQELEARIERDGKLARVEREILTQRGLMSKGQRKKVGKDQYGLPIYKWKADRKK